jgi:membrane-associated HD superfamily phosphohydrolase
MSVSVEELDEVAARSEYNQTLRSPKYTEPGGEDYWVQKKRVERMGKLWEKGHPKEVKLAQEREKATDKNLFDMLTKAGVTRESLEADEDKRADLADKEEMEKAQRNLELYFGGEKEADAAIKSAKSIFKRFATPADIAFVDKSQLGNDPEFIQKLAEIDQILRRGGHKRR